MQSDYEVNDGTGQEVLDDINQQIQALASNNSGASAPPVIIEGMFWYDSTNKIMKKRNASGGWDKMVTEEDAINLIFALG